MILCPEQDLIKKYRLYAFVLMYGQGMYTAPWDTTNDTPNPIRPQLQPGLNDPDPMQTPVHHSTFAKILVRTWRIGVKMGIKSISIEISFWEFEKFLTNSAVIWERIASPFSRIMLESTLPLGHDFISHITANFQILIGSFSHNRAKSGCELSKILQELVIISNNFPG